MIRYRSLVKAIIIVCPLLLLAAGCAGSKPSRFYMLSPVSGGPEGRAPASECRDLAIGVGPVDFPEYLDRPQIVTRTGEDILKLAEHDRWAEPLDRNFTRVLAENLSVLLATDRVYIFPWSRSVQVTHRVSVHVSRFDQGTCGAEVFLHRAGGCPGLPGACQCTGPADRDLEPGNSFCSSVSAQVGIKTRNRPPTQVCSRGLDMGNPLRRLRGLGIRMRWGHGWAGHRAGVRAGDTSIPALKG